ncbi:MAG: dockerin type I repeat-containing protein [Prevotella sp.]|nr:dockerin type I repeat-containing protein [Prevotella sp.]
MLKRKLILSVAMILFCVVTWAQSSAMPVVTEKSTDANEMPLTLEAIADGTVTFTNKAAGAVTYKVSGDDEVKTVESGTEANITLTAGQKASFFGDNDTYGESFGKISRINCTADCYIYGNIMSLINSKNYPTATELTRESTFTGLFSINTHIKNHPSKELLLPATTLTENCYENMFQDCTALTEAPALPATKMESACYKAMFYGCTALTKAPALPATQLDEWCYNAMFWGCTSLTEAPDLPAMKMEWCCYYFMFYGCTSLTKAPVLPAQKLDEGCYGDMFNGCEKLSSVTCLATDITANYCTSGWLSGVAAKGTIITKAGANWTSGASGIPEGWTEIYEKTDDGPLMLEAIADGTVAFLNNAAGPVTYRVSGDEVKTIDAETYTEITMKAGQQVWFSSDNTSYYASNNIQCDADCYVYGNVMSLISSKDYKTVTEIPEGVDFFGLFRGNTHIKNHPVHKLLLPATKLSKMCYSGMFNGCTGLTEAPALPATELEQSCYSEMFLGCTSLTKAPELPATTLANGCYSAMFQECTALTKAPVLPATELARDCYCYMFKDCEKLSSVTCLATDISADNCTLEWLTGVADKGTFTQAPGMTAWTRGENGIPEGWTVTDTLQNDIMGDANNDGEVTAADIVAITNYIIGNTPAGFSKANADVNLDGVINIADIVAVSNIILND